MLTKSSQDDRITCWTTSSLHAAETLTFPVTCTAEFPSQLLVWEVDRRRTRSIRESRTCERRHTWATRRLMMFVESGGDTANPRARNSTAPQDGQRDANRRWSEETGCLRYLMRSLNKRATSSGQPVTTPKGGHRRHGFTPSLEWPDGSTRPRLICMLVNGRWWDGVF